MTFGHVPFPIIMIVLFFGVLAVSVAISFVQKNRSNPREAMNALGHSLGLEILGGEPLFANMGWLSWIKRPLSLQGIHRGHKTAIRQDTRGSGKNKRIYSVIEVSLQTGTTAAMNIRKRYSIEKFFGRKNAFKTGVPDFDEGIQLKTRNPETAQLLLLPEICKRIADAVRHKVLTGIIVIGAASVTYEESGTLSQGKRSSRYVTMADICADIADALDTVSNLQTNGASRG